MRSTAETIELDSSLRQSRAIYVTLAVVLSPLATFGAISVISATTAIVEYFSAGVFPASAILVSLFGIVCIGAEYVTILQCFEASRRLKILRDNPEQAVRKMNAPFQVSLFGPYH